MIKRVGAFILVSLLGVGCGVGDDDKLEDNEPNPNGLVCSDAFKVSGTFTPGTPARPATDPNSPDPLNPDRFTGCWPVGKWTFTVTRDPGEENVLDITGDQKADRCGEVASTQAALIEPSYSFVVNRMDDAKFDYLDTYTLVDAVPTDGQMIWKDKIVYKIKVTEGGGGQCEGGLELYSRDGKGYWNLHPALLENNTLTGFGDFYLYEKPQI